jgi:hypothetical protein
MVRLLRGHVRPTGTGFGAAGKNLAHVEQLIIDRTGLPTLIRGTLNVALDQSYIVDADAKISASEYNGDIADARISWRAVNGRKGTRGTADPPDGG